MSRILITVPTWNEAPIIERNLKILVGAIHELPLRDHEVMIEIADNGSTDRTADIARSVAGVSVLDIEKKGKGIAIRRSWERHVDVDVLAFMDADLAADLSALPMLIEPILNHEADLVCGSRFVRGVHVERRWLREAASLAYRMLQRTVLRLPIKDAQCGFKAISTDAARILLPLLREDGWMFDTELLALAKAHQLRVREIPITWIEHRDPNHQSAINVFRDGWGFIRGVFRIRRRMR